MDLASNKGTLGITQQSIKEAPEQIYLLKSASQDHYLYYSNKKKQG